MRQEVRTSFSVVKHASHKRDRLGFELVDDARRGSDLISWRLCHVGVGGGRGLWCAWCRGGGRSAGCERRPGRGPTGAARVGAFDRGRAGPGVVQICQPGNVCAGCAPPSGCRRLVAVSPRRRWSRLLRRCHTAAARGGRCFPWVRDLRLQHGPRPVRGTGTRKCWWQWRRMVTYPNLSDTTSTTVLY